MDNSVPTLAAAVGFLGSAETILTNTYMELIGDLIRPTVIIIEPFSSRFHHFKYQPCISSLDVGRRRQPLPRIPTGTGGVQAH